MPEMGMVASGWELAARLLPYELYGDTAVVRIREDNLLRLYDVTPGYVPLYLGPSFMPHLPFPGPWEVEPDGS